MRHAVYCGLVALAVAAMPAQAARSVHHKTRPLVHKATNHSQQSIEDAAWSSGAAHTPKKTLKKTVSTKPDKLNPTVNLNTVQTPVISKPVVATPTIDPKATPGVVENKSSADLDKQARTEAAKNPKQALATYQKLVETDPNYPYSGDVYQSMYGLAVRTHADVLDQLKYAGLAGQKLEAGMSRNPVSPQAIKQYKGIEERLTNQWIQAEIQKIMAGKE